MSEFRRGDRVEMKWNGTTGTVIGTKEKRNKRKKSKTDRLVTVKFDNDKGRKFDVFEDDLALSEQGD